MYIDSSGTLGFVLGKEFHRDRRKSQEGKMQVTQREMVHFLNPHKTDTKGSLEEK